MGSVLDNDFSFLNLLILLFVFTVSFAVYLSMIPNYPPIWLDHAEMTISSYVLGISHPTGYPLYMMIGYVFTHFIPYGTVAFRANMMSAFFASLSCGVLYLIIRYVLMKMYEKEIGESKFYEIVAAVSALCFGFSETFWTQAIAAEIYSLDVFLLSLSILLLFKWDVSKNKRIYYLLFVIYGLCITMHFSNILFIPLVVMYIIISSSTLKPKTLLDVVLGIGVVFLTVFLLHLYIPIRQFTGVPYIWPGNIMWPTREINIALNDGLNNYTEYYYYFIEFGKNFAFKIPISHIHAQLSWYIRLILENFSWYGLILLILGMYIATLKANKEIVYILGIFVINIFFFLLYLTPDVNVFFIPSFFVGSIFIGIGLIHIYHQLNSNVKDLIEKTEVAKLAKKIWAITVIFILCLIPTHIFAENYNKVSEYALGGYFENIYIKYFFKKNHNSTVLTSNWAIWYLFKYYQLIEPKLNSKNNVLLLRSLNHRDIANYLSAGKPVTIVESKSAISCVNNSSIILHSIYPDQTSIVFYKISNINFLKNKIDSRIKSLLRYINYTYIKTDKGVVLFFTYQLNCSSTEHHNAKKLALIVYNKDVPLYIYYHELNCERFINCKNKDNILESYSVLVYNEILLSADHLTLYLAGKNGDKIPLTKVNISNIKS